MEIKNQLNFKSLSQMLSGKGIEITSNKGISDVISTIHFQHPKMDGKNTDYAFVHKKFIRILV